MPVVTKIAEQKRRPNRRSVYLDGAFAFGCNVNVVAKFHLREGMSLTAEQVAQIQHGEVKQECFDVAVKALESRLHSRSELHRKLTRREYGEPVVIAVLDDLARLGYLDDERFAKTKALSAAQYKHHGRRRAFMELRKAGVSGEVADKALADVYSEHD
ncbi:MAG TPA: RecX family transcriptional regulator, partial [Tepidisphaeraceae bacterium]|nr:RecX family transcriptional regulator [Tepidisphaeraceae bacterium]